MNITVFVKHETAFPNLRRTKFSEVVNISVTNLYARYSRTINMTSPFTLIQSLQSVRKIFIDILYIIIGTLIITPGILLYFVITVPFILYRALITTLLLKYSGYRKMVSRGFETAHALEYVSCVSKGQPSKNTILTRIVIDGHVPFDICVDHIKTKWITSRTNNNQWKFPKFREYVHSWMGYSYWRQDPHFDFNSHIHCYSVNDSQSLDEYISNRFENLLNKPFLPKRSPWDVYVLHGLGQMSEFDKETLSTNSKAKITVFVVRTHHVLADGISLVSLIKDDLFGNYTEGCQIQEKEKSASQFTQKFTHSILIFPAIIKLLRDLGFMTAFILCNAEANTKLHVPNYQKLRYVHQMSSLISMEKVKIIRNKFKVSFSAVMVASLAAAIAEFLNENRSDKFLLAAPRPLAGRPKENMINYL